MKPGIVIQARMGSTRLPGKVLEQIEGKAMLERVVERVRRASLTKTCIVATTTNPADDEIVELCDDLQVSVCRGDEEDVLDRYYRAARAHRIHPVVRVTSDCPLIDPALVDRVVERFLAVDADYASNCVERRFPRGLGVEAMAFSVLERTWREAPPGHHRNHVTSYIYSKPREFQLSSVTQRRDFSHLRWTVDTPEDLAFVRAIYARFGRNEHFTWEQVLDVLRQEPELSLLNQHVRHKELSEG